MINEGSSVLWSWCLTTIIDTDEACYVCHEDENPDVLLICDHCQFHCCHIYCCSPPLQTIPEEDWICVFCNAAEERQNAPHRRRRANNPYRLNISNNQNQEEQTLLERLFEITDDISNVDEEQLRALDLLEDDYAMSRNTNRSRANQASADRSTGRGASRSNAVQSRGAQRFRNRPRETSNDVSSLLQNSRDEATRGDNRSIARQNSGTNAPSDSFNSYFSQRSSLTMDNLDDYRMQPARRPNRRRL